MEDNVREEVREWVRSNSEGPNRPGEDLDYPT